MNVYLKYLTPLLILFLVICIGTLLVNSVFRIDMKEPAVISLTVSFAFSAFLSLVVFIKGLSREPDVQAMHTFVAVGIKFLIELFIALVWFVAAKKNSPAYILLFFVLYLAFTSFSIVVILKTLKKKSL
jgi:hypothetical protein